MLDDLKMIHQRDSGDALGIAERQIRDNDFLTAASQNWLPNVPTIKNYAKQIAQDCIGKSIVIYGSPELAEASRSWKTAFNKNAKQLAWVGQLDDFIGWMKQPVDKPYAVIFLKSKLDELTEVIFNDAERSLSGLMPAPISIELAGDSVKEQALWVTALGDFVTIYTALLSGIDPSQH